MLGLRLSLEITLSIYRKGKSWLNRCLISVANRQRQCVMSCGNVLFAPMYGHWSGEGYRNVRKQQKILFPPVSKYDEQAGPAPT